MVSIALITEGVTDQLIIKPIIESYYKDIDFRFKPIRPLVDETDMQTSFGNWYNVICACKEESFTEIFSYNDFIVVQIDADVSQEPHFDVPHIEAGQQIENKRLCENIITKLISLIPDEVWKKYNLG